MTEKGILESNLKEFLKLKDYALRIHKDHLKEFLAEISGNSGDN